MKISDFNEASPYELVKRWASKTSQPRQYEKAAETLHNVLVKKSRENNINHSLGYYAQQIGKQFAGIDYRALVDFYKERYGAEGLAEFKIVKPDTKDTMGIKRNQMPQVATKDYPEFLDYLKDNGAHFTKDTVPADSLKAIQGEFSDQGVEKALKLRKIEKPLIASSDNYIIDGHHRWLAALNTGVEVNIFRVDIPGQELLQLVKDFPKTTYKDIYTEAADPDISIEDLNEGPQDFADMKLDSNKLQQSLDYFYKDHAPNKIGGREEVGAFKGYNIVTFTKGPDTLMFLVDKDDQAVFYVAYRSVKDGVAVGNVRSNGSVRATEVYAHLVSKFGTLYSDDKQTPQGRKIWADLAKFFPDISVTDTGDRLRATNKVSDQSVKEAYEINGSLVDKFLKATGGKYGKRDQCGPACLDFIDWAKQQGIELKRVRGEFVADEVVHAKADFTPEMKKEFMQSGLDWNSAADRKAWIEQSKYAEEWKRVPHYWTVDKDGNIHDPSGYQQLVKTGLAKDLDPSRYIPEGVNEATDIVNIPAGHILLSDYAKEHISTHNKPGIGSVFSKNINLQKLVDVMQDIPVQGEGGAYTINLPGAGYNLVLPIEDAKSLPDAQLGTVNKQERGPVEVPAVKTSAPIEQFATNEITVIVRPSNPAYLPDDVKQNKQVLDAIKQGKSYSVITAFPGGELPPASQWNGKYAVIIPNANKSESIREAFVEPQFDVEWDEAARYPEFQKIGKEAWIELAKKGTAITIKSAKGINNTDAADPDSFKSLDPAKQKRALAQLKSGDVEMPIVAVYSDGYKELIGGNTRLTAMMAKDGKATVWAFKVPDEVATLAEAKEIEFVCVNPAYDDATKQHEQDALFQALKDVPGVIVYRQDFDIHNSMAAILKSNADVKEIKALAKKHNVKIDLTKNVSDRFIDALYTGDLEGVTDWYDSDNLNEALLAEDATPKMFYHGSYDELPVGTVLTPRGNDYESEWGGTHFYGALEKHRPPEKLAHKEGVFMVGNEEDIDLAGGATDYIYIVKPIGQVQRHDVNWGSQISMLVDDGAGLNDPEVKQAADNYWNGVPFEGDNVWEYIAPRAKIVGVLDEAFFNKFKSLTEDQLNEIWPWIARVGGPALLKALSKLKKAPKSTPKQSPKVQAPKPQPKRSVDRLKNITKSAAASAGTSDDGAGFADGYRKGIAISSSAIPKGKKIKEVSSKDNYGIPDGATLAQLDKIAKTAKNPEKRERAHYLRNMRRGKNK
jgi:hypothetical protein